MKTLFSLTILFWVITFPVNAQLKDTDLDKIRLIVKEEIEDEIKPIKDDIETLKVDVASLSGRMTGIEKTMTWLMVIIVVAVGLPQVIIAWRSRNDREQNRKIETLKQQRIVNP